MWSLDAFAVPRQPRRPRPFVRFSHAQVEQMIEGLRDEIKRQDSARKAFMFWVTARLDDMAQGQPTADALQQLIREIEEGPK